MIYNDELIERWASNGGVTPFDATLVNPASIDLRLGDHVCRLADYDGAIRYGSAIMGRMWGYPDEFKRLTVYPGMAVLMASLETIAIPDNACAALYSKSTLGRCLIEHAHAGWIDPGFIGTVTFEFFHVGENPIVFEPGDRVVQLVLSALIAPARKPYSQAGRYQGQVLPTAPKGW